jgi:hypothetical protein
MRERGDRYTDSGEKSDFAHQQFYLPLSVEPEKGRPGLGCLNVNCGFACFLIALTG